MSLFSQLKCSGLLEILCSVQSIYSGLELIGGGIFDTKTSHYFRKFCGHHTNLVHKIDTYV